MMGPEVIFITTTHDHSRVDIPMIEQGFRQEKSIVDGDDVCIGTRFIIYPVYKLAKGWLLAMVL